MTSRFLQKVTQPASRFLAQHPTMSRFLHKLPIVGEILDALDPPPQPQLTPVYNTRARKPKGPTLG